MNQKQWAARVLCTTLVAAGLGACDFVDSTVTNPNAVPESTADQLFTAIQVNTYFFTEGQVSRITAMWTQQMAGTDRQFASLDRYELKEDDADPEFSTIYTGGGLIDLRRAESQVEAAGRRPYLGVLQIHEAYLIGMAASIWGDLPYTEAANPATPRAQLDPQPSVYAAVQTLLDQAIANLQSGTGTGPGAADLNFGGNLAKWTAVAHSLRARYYLHWVEAQRAGGAAAQAAQTACAGDCTAKAIAAAQQGIASSADNWRAIHSTASTENNLWYQFLRDRSGYISAGAYLVELLRSRGDPRLEFYFSEGSGPNEGRIVGSPPGTPAGDPGTTSSVLAPGGVGASDYDSPILSCAETQFILAEAHYYQGNTAAANAALQAGIACQASQWGVGLPPVGTLAGPALLQEIMTQKYIALFLNMEAYNDFKRTCLPTLISNEFVNVRNMPGRLFYGQRERQTNPNLPVPNQQPARNANDPAGC